MTVLVMGGTTESRRAAVGLREAGYSVLVSTATEFGGELVDHEVAVRSGRLSEAGLTAIAHEHGVRAIVDATHPFAGEIKVTTQAVCSELGLPYLRLERPAAELPLDLVTVVDTFPAAADAALRCGERVFLATGVKSIGMFAASAGKAGGPELFARILPTVESITEALKWLPAAHIVAAVGPFDSEFDRSCWKRFKVDTLVTKDSGAGVGVEDKINSALEMGLKVIVIERPRPDPNGFTDLSLMIEELVRNLLSRTEGS